MFIIPKPQKLVFFEGQYAFQELITSEKSLNKIKKDTDFFGIDIKKGRVERRVDLGIVVAKLLYV